jgi:hypothetical protein
MRTVILRAGALPARAFFVGHFILGGVNLEGAPYSATARPPLLNTRGLGVPGWNQAAILYW